MQGKIVAIDSGAGLIETPRGNAFAFAACELVGKAKAAKPGTKVDFLINGDGQAVEIVDVDRQPGWWTVLNGLIFL